MEDEKQFEAWRKLGLKCGLVAHLQTIGERARKVAQTASCNLERGRPTRPRRPVWTSPSRRRWLRPAWSRASTPAYRLAFHIVDEAAAAKA